MREPPDLDPQFEPPHAEGGAHGRWRASGSVEVPEALRGALIGYEVSMERLNSAVVAFVEELKAKRVAIEQVVPEVRAYLSALPRWAQPVDGILPADMTIVDRAIQWAIEAFYEERGESETRTA